MEVSEKPSDLPLEDTKRLSGQKRRIAELSAKAQAVTGVVLPKYYNPSAVNPLKYAEQVQKRKLLWQGSKDKKVGIVIILQLLSYERSIIRILRI